MRKKGFTLIELIIVIAIIGVLAGVLIPSWSAYIQRARTRSQNLKAKTILNAAQTVVTDMKFYERKGMNKYMNAADDKKAGIAEKYLYGTVSADGGVHTEWYYYWNGSTGTIINADGTSFESKSYSQTAILNKWNKEISDSINKIINEDELVYKIYVRDYKVMSVVSARFASDRYLGTYPITLDEIDNSNTLKGKIAPRSVASIRNGQINNVNMNDFVIPNCTESGCTKNAVKPEYKFCSEHQS